MIDPPPDVLAFGGLLTEGKTLGDWLDNLMVKLPQMDEGLLVLLRSFRLEIKLLPGWAEVSLTFPPANDGELLRPASMQFFSPDFRLFPDPHAKTRPVHAVTITFALIERTAFFLLPSQMNISAPPAPQGGVETKAPAPRHREPALNGDQPRDNEAGTQTIPENAPAREKAQRAIESRGGHFPEPDEIKEDPLHARTHSLEPVAA